MRHIRIDDDVVVCKLRGGQQGALLWGTPFSGLGF